MIVRGWIKIPNTYFRTLDAEDAMEFHRQVSPRDRLGKPPSSRRVWQQAQRRGKL